MSSHIIPLPGQCVQLRDMGAEVAWKSSGISNATIDSFFAEGLELFLTRDSVEALLRVRYGLKTAGGRSKLGKSRLIVKATSPGDWYGARISVERNVAGKPLFANPVPQVAFRKHGETEWKWFLEEEMDDSGRWERYRN